MQRGIGGGGPALDLKLSRPSRPELCRRHQCNRCRHPYSSVDQFSARAKD